MFRGPNEISAAYQKTISRFQYEELNGSQGANFTAGGHEIVIGLGISAALQQSISGIHYEELA